MKFPKQPQRTKSLLFSILIPRFGEVQEMQERVDRLLGDVRIEVIVVDNGPDILALSSRARLQVLRTGKNEGFSKALNLAAQMAQGSVLVCMNPDTELEPDQLHTFWQEATRRGWSVASPSLGKKEYHQPLPSFFSLLGQFSPLKHVFWLPSFGAQTLPGACLAVQRKEWEQLGGWSEEFWLWWEDSDFSYRLKQKGIPFGVVESVRISHTGGSSFEALSTRWKRHVFFHSLRVFTRKHFWWWQARIIDVVTSRFDSHRLYPVDEHIRASVVVPNMRLELLKSFLRFHAPHWDWSQDELIVVSSASDTENLRAEYPQVVWIQLADNSGFAPTVNAGFRRARGQWVGTVNDDVRLPAKFVGQLVAKAKKTTGTLQPQVVSPNGEVESFGVVVDPRGKAWGVTEEQSHAQTLNGAAFLVRHEVLEEVGLFDERFGSYLEDVDLGLRISQAGWEHAVVPNVTVIHQKHQTSRFVPVRKVWQDTKNWWLIVIKHYWWSHWLRVPHLIVLERVRNLSGLLKAVVHTDSVKH